MGIPWDTWQYPVKCLKLQQWKIAIEIAIEKRNRKKKKSLVIKNEKFERPEMQLRLF